MRLFNLLLVFIMMGMVATQAQPSPASDHANLRLTAAETSVAPGETIEVGLHIELEDGWHVYWRNPGDSGIPVRIKWNEADKVTFGAIQWPAPTSFFTEHLVTYGYKDQSLLIIPVHIAEDARQGNHILEARVDYLVCKEICLPGFENHSVVVQVDKNSARPSRDNALFQEFKQKMPVKVDGVEASFTINDKKLHLKLTGDFSGWGDLSNLRFFAGDENRIESSAGQNIKIRGNVIEIELTLSRYLNEEFDTLYGVIIPDEKNHATSFEIVAKRK